MVKSLPGLGLIAAIVGVAFLINDFQPAVSPLALCVAFGFAVANFGRWPSFAAAGTSLASKKLMRIGVALLVVMGGGGAWLAHLIRGVKKPTDKS
jgi:uncharacterized membrane protein YadS